MTIVPAEQEGGRRLVHLGSAVLPLGYWMIGQKVGIVILIGLTLAMISLELARMYTDGGHRLYQRFFGTITRPTEAHRFTGATYVFTGALLVAVLYQPKIAILSMLFMSIGDSTAAFVGQRFGRIPLAGKTLEGTLACLCACLLITLPADLSWVVALAGAATATLVELIPIPYLNDNLAIPVFSGGIMTALTSLGL